MAFKKFRIDKARWHSEVETLALAQNDKAQARFPVYLRSKAELLTLPWIVERNRTWLPDLGEVVSVRGPHDDAAKSKPSSRFFARYDGSINAPRRSDNRAPIFRMDLPRLVRRVKLTGENKLRRLITPS